MDHCMAEHDLTWEGYIRHLWRKKNEGSQGCQNRVLTRKIVRFYESKHALRVESLEKIENE